MAGSIVVEERYFERQRSVICKCTSDSIGNVSGTGFEVQGGNLYGLHYVPVTGVSDAFDLTATMKIPLNNGQSISLADCLGGQGANLSNSTDGDYIVLSEPHPLPPKSILTPTIANLGDTKVVYLIFNIWEEV